MEYCFTHSLLLSTSGPNTLYCVIFSLEGIESDRNGGQRVALEQLTFWLRFLSITQSSQSKPHVIVIGSHLDTLPTKDGKLIAKRFYENVRRTEFKLFSCFHIQFFPINCTDMNDVKAIREPVSKTVSQVLQDSTIDAVPEICQQVMEHISHLRSQKIHFQQWKEFAECVQQKLPFLLPLPDTLLTVVEYLHNISELLFLPQYLLQGKHSATKPYQNLSNDLQCDAIQTPNRNLASGSIIFDLTWLLQDIFGAFGNYALSPASGTHKERWTSKEIAEGLNLTDCKVDSEGALELLEAFQLILKTQEGEFVVPSWLKKGGPERHGGCENMRGIGYRWNDGSRGLFSHFLVGHLQIQLMRMFGTDRCKLWKEGALVVTKAQLRVEVSEDRRSLYLIGGWRLKDAEGDCYHLLEKVGKEVEILIRNEHEQYYEKLHLCPTELRNITVTSEVATHVGVKRSTGIIEEISGFSFEQILEAEKNNKPLYGKWSIQPWEVLFPQHDTRMLFSLGMNCRTRWLESATLLKLCSLLDTKSPVGQNWKMLAELLGQASNSMVTEIKEEARNKGLSPTNLILNKYPVSLYQLKECLNKMGREDCANTMDNMMLQLKYQAEN
ncbi:death-associated protein kinase 1-like [Dendropsophus ebraccatus]|uniref:death-associated protein kinase 1-like n=1 Tax=Dendropsophus ebraccatus TaxID=150705 RepID=UPI003831146B